jgi:FkbM family methyltransferase
MTDKAASHSDVRTPRDISYRLTKLVMRSPLGAAARRVLPPSARRVLRSAVDLPVMRHLAADRPSQRRLLHMSANSGSANASARPVPVHLRGLPGREVHIRPGTADVAVVRDLMMKQPHLPPDTVELGDVRLVWDLGAHIGLASLDYAERWPNARVVAVELEPKNAAVCRLNLAQLGERCEVIEAAVWASDGEVRIGLESDDGDTNAFRAESGSDGGGRAVTALSLDTLLTRTSGEDPVDLCKLDIEGAERRVLREHTDWARRVRTLAVEVHDDYTAEDCADDLRRLGFEAIRQGRAENIVIGIRDPAAAGR